MAHAATLGRAGSSLGYQRTHDGSSKPITDEMDKQLWNKAVHSQHTRNIGAKDIPELAALRATQHTKVDKKRILIPVEETVEVPVYRQKVDRKSKKAVVYGTKMVPVTKYKHVEETTLQTVVEIVNGRKEKRAIPVTKTREIPYTEYEPQEVPIEVNVPDDGVVQMVGTRRDKHVVSKVVEVEQDHHYEMRPVLVAKGEKRMKELGDHHSFKLNHGACTWDGGVQPWQRRPKTPPHKTGLARPGSASSVRSDNTTLVMPRLQRMKYDPPKVPGQLKQYVPGKSRSVPAL